MTKSQNHSCDSRVTISHEEMIEICKRVVVDSGGVWRFKSYISVDEAFLMLLAIEKPRFGWFHRYSNHIFVLAGISLLFLTAKSLAEAYMGAR